MDKTSFLKELENALEGEVSREVINDTLHYYNQYIVNEVSAGKSEEEVIKGLGSGNVIAKTVIASREAKDTARRDAFSERQKGYGTPEEKGFHMSMDEQGNMKLKYGRFQLNSWYGRLVGLLIAVFVIALLIMLVAGLFSLLWALLPLFIIGFIIITIINFFMS